MILPRVADRPIGLLPVVIIVDLVTTTMTTTAAATTTTATTMNHSIGLVQTTRWHQF